jgi:bacillithiol biosynthesis cysteine-adding enzyme BshC
MLGVNYKEISGFSNLFIDFIERKPFFHNVFPSNNLLDDDNFLRSKAESVGNRDAICRVIRKSMECLSLSQAQTENIEKLSYNNCLTVATGQQVGFLGGPVYTALKAMDCIRLASEMSLKHRIFYFVPVFWLEDNDHDSLEASTAAIIDSTNCIKQYSCAPDESVFSRVSVSERAFDDVISKVIDRIIESLPQNSTKESISDLLRRIYLYGKRWSDAFCQVTQEIFADYGLLFLKASDARKSCMFAAMAQKELECVGASFTLVQNANEALSANGYHLQAKASRINLFYHNGAERLKIVAQSENGDKIQIGNDSFAADELISKYKGEPRAFSPNVMLRPVFQDGILPNIAYVAGPSEIGYSCQISGLYKHFGVIPAAIFPRHSATFIDRKTQELLNTENIEPQSLMKDFIAIENKLFEKERNVLLDSCFRKLKDVIQSDFRNIINEAEILDSSLRRSGETHLKQVLSHVENFEGKVRAIEKRNYSVMRERYRRASNLLYPKNTLQERKLSVVSLLSIIGIDRLKSTLNELMKMPADLHYFI